MESVEIDGAIWSVFAIDYKADGKTYTFDIYAKSFEHAQDMLAGIKSTAVVAGLISDRLADGGDITSHRIAQVTH